MNHYFTTQSNIILLNNFFCGPVAQAARRGEACHFCLLSKLPSAIRTYPMNMLVFNMDDCFVFSLKLRDHRKQICLAKALHALDHSTWI
jgi:hypothetical protein